MQETRDAPDLYPASQPSQNEPWRRRSDWATGRVRDETGASGLGLFALWLFCILWFGGLSLVMYGMRGVEASAQLGLRAFMVAGLLPLAVTLDQTRLHVRFRRSLFVMASVPGVVGGRLEGVIELPMRLKPGSCVRVALSCWRRSDRQTRRNAAPAVVWEAVADNTAVLPGSPARVPVAFEIPFELPQSEVDPMRSGVSWVLSLEGTQKARGIRGRFVVPVYLTAASRSAQDGGPRAVTTQPASSDVKVYGSSPGVLDLRFRFGPVARFCVIFLPIALPITFAVASQVRWAGALLGDPSTGTFIVTGLIVAFAIVAHIMEPMGVRVEGGQVTLLRGYRGWFPATRVALSDVVAVKLQERDHHLQEVVLQMRNSADLSVSRTTTPMEARWIAQELRRAISDIGGSLPELTWHPLLVHHDIQGSVGPTRHRTAPAAVSTLADTRLRPDDGAGERDGVASRAKEARTSVAVPLLVVLSPLLLLAAAGLMVFGVPVLNWFFVQVGLQSVPPPRPPSLPHAAQPIAVYGNASSEVTEWKWVVCEEREAPRYACRVYGGQERLEIVGDYWAHAGRYGIRGGQRQGRLPNPGEMLEYSSLYNSATMHLTWPPGAELIARGVLLFPASGTKATVLGEDGNLSDETPMSAEERATVAR